MALVLFVVFYSVLACFIVGEFIPLFFLFGKIKKRNTATPALSVVIPVKNEEAVIEKALEHWIRISYPASVEIIFCDQDSTDATAEIIKKKTKQHAVLSYYNFSGKNKLEALLEGVTQAKYDHIVLADVDRFPNKHGLSQLVHYLSDDVVSVFGMGVVANNHNFQRYITTLDFLNNMIELPFYCNLQSASSLYLHSCIVRKDVLLRMNPQHLIADDLYMALEIVKQGKRALFIPEIIVGEERVINFSDVIKRKLRTFQGSIEVIKGNYSGTGFNPKYGVYGLILMPFSYILTIGKLLSFLFTLIFPIALLFNQITFRAAFMLIVTVYLLLLVSQILRFLAFKKLFTESVTRIPFWITFIHPLYVFLIRRVLWGYTFFITLGGIKFAWKQSHTDRI